MKPFYRTERSRQTKRSGAVTHRQAVEEVDEHGTGEGALSAGHEGHKGLPKETRHSLHFQVPHCFALGQVVLMSQHFGFADKHIYHIEYITAHVQRL